MNIYLMQHGKPVSKQENPEKPLSAQGRADMERMGAFLKRSGVIVDGIFHSGKTRARQTAEIISAMLLPGKEPEEKKGLAPLDDAKLIFNEILQLQGDFMIVGHLPHLAKLTSLLITGSESNSVVSFQQGGVVCCKPDEETKEWHIAWMLVPEIIQH